jgi:hypothetical protein
MSDRRLNAEDWWWSAKRFVGFEVIRVRTRGGSTALMSRSRRRFRPPATAMALPAAICGVAATGVRGLTGRGCEVSGEKIPPAAGSATRHGRTSVGVAAQLRLTGMFLIQDYLRSVPARGWG